MADLKVVIDTNVLLVSVSRKSPHHWLFQAVLNAKFQVCVTTEMLLEYEEIIATHMGERASHAALSVFEHLPNVVRVFTHFNFELLDDLEDNKFVDCYVAAGADCLVSEDGDFRKLDENEFPFVKLVRLSEFKALVDDL